MHNIGFNTVSNMTIIQISSKEDLGQSFDCHSCFLFFFSFTVFLWSHLNFFTIYLFVSVMVHLDAMIR